MKDILQYIPFLFTLKVLALAVGFNPAQPCLAFLKSMADSPPIRNGYLSFQSPPKLRFHEVEAMADRRKLMTLHKKKEEKDFTLTTENQNDSPSFPLISYEEENETTPTYSIPSSLDEPVLIENDLLPPNDPFLDQKIPDLNLNNTDELIEILEGGIGTTSRNGRTEVDFIPPYTMDGGNMLLESKSKYIRRARQ